MTTKTKLTALLFITVCFWQVTLTDSNKMKIGCWPAADPCKESDLARRNLYGWMGAAALGVILRKNKTED
ncbi:hypothetical protein OAK87_01410 [bacterium]|nr:hypothetical protein [bacterium]